MAARVIGDDNGVPLEAVFDEDDDEADDDHHGADHSAARARAASLPWAITPTALAGLVATADAGGYESHEIEPSGDYGMLASRVGGLVTVPVYGALIARSYARAWGAMPYDVITSDVQQAANDPQVRAILLDIASPGGSVTGCLEAVSALYALRGRKPLVAFVSGDACSAAYWLASACEEVVSAETAVLGCLGVQAYYLDDAGWLAQLGLEEIIITSAQTPDKNLAPTDDAGYAQWQQMVDDLAEVMLDSIAANRGIGRADLDRDFGKGQVLVGARAKAAGLVDRLSSLDSLSKELRTGAFQRTSRAGAIRATVAPRSTAKANAVASAPDAEQAERDSIAARIEGLRKLSPGIFAKRTTGSTK